MRKAALKTPVCVEAGEETYQVISWMPDDLWCLVSSPASNRLVFFKTAFGKKFSPPGSVLSSFRDQLRFGGIHLCDDKTVIFLRCCPSELDSHVTHHAQRTCSCGEGTARNSGSKRFCSQCKGYGKTVHFYFFLFSHQLLRFSQRYYLIHV